MQPTQLGPYTITSSLGRGGMGAVYEAVDRSTGRTVAVKTLATHLGDDPGLRRRFAAEIETLKALRHPCIVQLLAFGEEDGLPYFAMELVRGRSLEQLLRSGRRFTWRETVDTAVDIVRALKSAHDHGVIHRDLKPANLIVPDEPAADATVKLADFGIARLFGGAGQTMAGMIVGTAEYMSPEQTAGAAVDNRADLYNLGLVMFAMLTGRPPFHGGQAAEVIQRQRNEAPPRVSSRVADVPVELDDLIDRLLAKDAGLRPASSLAVGRVLAALAARPAAAVTAAPPSAAPDAAALPTACDESGQPTVPLPASARGVDLLAATREFGVVDAPAQAAAVLPGSITGRDVPADAPTMPVPTKPEAAVPMPQQSTEPAAAGGRHAARASRFTTVEELERASEAEAVARGRRDRRIHAAVATVIAAVLAGGGYFLLRPPTADELHDQIMAIASDDGADLRDARPLIDRFLTRHAEDPRVAKVRDLDRTLDLDALEKRARRRRLDDRGMPPLEREYRAAMAREDESPLACVAALEAILALHANDPPATAPTAESPSDPALWLALVRRQIDRLQDRAGRERAEDVAKATAALDEAASLAAAAATSTDADEQRRLLDRRRGLLAGLVEIYSSRPHMADAVTRAKALLDALPRTPPAP